MNINSQEKIQKQNLYQTSISKCEKCGNTGWIKGENGYKRCECYELERVKQLWVNYGVNTRDIKKINSYEVYNDATRKAKSIAIKYVTDFENICKDEENWMLLMGQPGGGKTHLAVGVGSALLEKKIAVVYMPYLEVMRNLKANAREDEGYEKIISRYKRAKVLIIDDLFKDKIRNGELAAKLSDIDTKHIYPILNYRSFNRLPTIISTECTEMDFLKLDEALAGRILERCKPYSVKFRSDCNYRLKKYRE